MKISKIALSLFLAVISTQAFAAGGTCKKCEALRDYHSKHPSEYTYYEDYLKAMKEKGEIRPQDDPDFPSEYCRRIGRRRF